MKKFLTVLLSLGLIVSCALFVSGCGSAPQKTTATLTLNVAEKDYDATAVVLDIDTNSDGVASYQWSKKGADDSYSSIDIAPSNAGVYKVTVSIPATDSYTEVSKTFDFVINKAERNITIDATHETYIKEVADTYGVFVPVVLYTYAGQGSEGEATVTIHSVENYGTASETISATPIADNEPTDTIVKCQLISVPETENYKAGQKYLTYQRTKFDTITRHSITTTPFEFAPMYGFEPSSTYYFELQGRQKINAGQTISLRVAQTQPGITVKKVYLVCDDGVGLYSFTPFDAATQTNSKHNITCLETSGSYFYRVFVVCETTSTYETAQDGYIRVTEV